MVLYLFHAEKSLFIVSILLFCFCGNQPCAKTAWLIGLWTGRAYLPTVDSQSYNLTLEIDKVKTKVLKAY